MRIFNNINNLSEFYSCKEWIELMNNIRLQRNNICEHCHKPIVNTYGSIGHHKIHLTESNYKDANISLNPDNIMLVHAKCHNQIHGKLSYIDRQIYLVYGSPFSGKSTYVKDNMDIGDLVIDMDNIWQCISNCDRYIKPNRLKSNAFIIRDTLLDMVRMRTGKWQNAWVIGGYPLISERERLANQLGAKTIFVDTSKDECLKRLSQSDDSRDKTQWEMYINDWWDKYSPPYLDSGAP